MTLDIALVLGILVVSLILFVTEWLRMDVVALLVLATLALTGLVSPTEALAGFSNPAVVTVWAMFMLSAGLTRTGVADVIGRWVLGLAGRGEMRMITVVMLTSAVLSAFMNNIGVAALLLPVVMDISRRTGTSPSRLLMPLAFGSLLGGLTTLIGTPPNLLVSQALRDNGLEPFRLFDFTPVGGVVMLAGVAFVAIVGRRWLPRGEGRTAGGSTDLQEEYALRERAVVLRIPQGSKLVGKTLRESHLGSAARLNVVAVTRGGRTSAAPDPGFVLHAGDRLVVEGLLDRFRELKGWRELIVEEEDLGPERLVSDRIRLAEVRLAARSSLVGLSLDRADFRRRFGVIVLAVVDQSEIRVVGLASRPLEAGDRLLVQGPADRLEALPASAEFEAVEPTPPERLAETYRLSGRIFAVRVPANSFLVGKSLAESRLGDALGLGVLGVLREGHTVLMPDPDERLAAGDRLLVRGKPDDLEVLRGLQELEIDSEQPRQMDALESEQFGLVEATLSPRTTLVGKTLRELHFREKFGLQVLAIQRQGRSHRSNLRDMELCFGDALLLLGRRERLMLLAREPDFLVLTQAVQEVRRTELAPLAALVMAAVLVPVLLGWLPIAIAAVAGATVMVLLRCLTMEEAYRAVEWRSIFLIAGMLPLGAAMQQTEAASYLAENVLELLGPLGPWGVIVGLYLVTAAATMIIPTAALVVLMAPIVLRASTEMDISAHAAMMAVAVAASASFTSPISHPANVLVMGPGGYRFADYLKLGVPLTLVVLIVALLVLPVFWPL